MDAQDERIDARLDKLEADVAELSVLAERVVDRNAEMKELLRDIHGHVGEDIQASIEELLGEERGWVPA